MFEAIHGIDVQILAFIRETIHCGFLDALMPVITFLGNGGILWIAITVVLLFSKKYRKYGVLLATALLCFQILGNFTLKPLIARARPFIADPSLQLIIDPPSGYSFPSGHTMSSFAAVPILWFANKKWGVSALVVAMLIAFSRLYLQVHYPSDVLVGAVLGLALSFGVLAVFKKIMKNAKAKPKE